MYFSLVVPIYNVENYLPQCIESILNQSFTDYEIILVDDGSTDHCPQICDKYSGMFTNVTVIHKKNGGLSDARNCGIRRAKGKYICFVDSDDYWEGKNALSDLFEIAENSSPDIIRIGMKQIRATDGKVISARSLDFSGFDKLDNTGVLRRFVETGTLKISACSMIIRRDFLVKKKLFFVKGIRSEDIEWAIRAFEHTPSWAFYSGNIFVTRRGREGSISSTVSYDHLIDYLKIIINTAERLERNTNSEVRFILLSYLMYQELILTALIGVTKIERARKERLNRNNGILCKRYLCKYTLDKRVMFASKVYRMFGYDGLQTALAFYLKNRRR